MTNQKESKINCQRKGCKEEGKYWYPWDGIIYNLCESCWHETNKRRFANI